MAGKLDQSLDDIVSTRRQTARRPGRGRRVPNPTRATGNVAPVGGVSKNARPARGNAKSTHPAVPIVGNGESKIIVSGLPSDVSEQQIKDYFAKTIGPVKKVFLTYGPNGQSRGISTVVFNKPGSALEAATQLNGVKVDNRAMKIEVIVGAEQAPVPVPAKTLGDRIAQPKPTAKSQPKPAATARNGATTEGRGRGRGRRGGGRNAGRGKPKTAQELDAEMVDYFDATAEGAGGAEMSGVAPTNGAVQPVAANSGDAGMDDEIM